MSANGFLVCAGRSSRCGWIGGSDCGLIDALQLQVPQLDDAWTFDRGPLSR
jgi:hypothetical protein